MKIDNRSIGRGEAPYIIAEMSANHNGSIQSAFQIIREAKNAGADAVKIQTYTADTMTMQSESSDFQIHGGLWDGWTLYRLYEWAHTPWEWHKELFDFAHALDITLFSTPFDASAVDFLEDLGVPAYKIASFEVNDLDLISYVASTRKPLIISTGMADINEIQEAIDTARSSGCQELAILHCVSGYPAPPSDYNLRTIPDMQQRFGVITGLSDHTLGNATALSAIALGASIVEKHFTLDRNGGGPDDSFSMEPPDLKSLCDDSLTVWNSLGTVDYKKKDSEIANLKFRRSLYFNKDMKAGEVITRESVRCIRPGYGLEPKKLTEILGKQVARDVYKATPVKSELLK